MHPYHITDELLYMKALCSIHNWSRVDVMDYSVEEIAATILNMVSDNKRLER